MEAGFIVPNHEHNCSDLTIRENDSDIEQNPNSNDVHYVVDEFGLIFRFNNVKNCQSRFYVDAPSAKLNKKLSQLDDLPQWLFHLKQFCQYWQCTDVTVYKNLKNIDSTQDAILYKVIIESFEHDMTPYIYNYSTASRLIHKLLFEFQELYTDDRLQKMWMGLNIGPDWSNITQLRFHTERTRMTKYDEYDHNTLSRGI